jgi:hypothetical protein
MVVLSLLVAIGLTPRASGQPFSDCLSTVTNATLVIPSDVASELGPSGQTLSAGDQIAVFTDDGLCAGAGAWSEETLSIAAAGVNPVEEVGFEPGGAFQFRIWDASEEAVHASSAAYAPCEDDQPLCQSEGTYQQDMIYVVTALTASEDGGSGDEAVTVTDVTASTAQDPNVAANTIDNDRSTRWSAFGKGAWVQHTLSAETTLDRVGIAWYKGNVRRATFAIALSTDGSSWTTVYEGTSNGSTLHRETYTFKAAPARYVRITGYGNTQNRWTSITEVDVVEGGNRPLANKQLAMNTEFAPDESLPETFTLNANYPNPARHRTTIPYALPASAHVVLDVYDLLGRRVARPVDTAQPPGRYTATVDVSSWSSGVYIYRLRAGDEIRQGRLVVVQ